MKTDCEETKLPLFCLAAKLFRNRNRTATTRVFMEKFHKQTSLIFVLINTNPECSIFYEMFPLKR